jgi:hypothetical protein
VAQKKAYSRYFIILQEDENGYSLASDKLPSGYTKLETKNDKCKVSFYVQNLKKEKEPYEMVLICNRKDTKKLVKLGMLNIDEYGRAEVTYEFNANDLAGSKSSIETVGGAAIVKAQGSELTSVMCGFASTEPAKDWRSYALFEQRQEDTVKERNFQEVEKEEVIVVQENQAAAINEKEELKEEVSKREEALKEEVYNQEEHNVFAEYEQKIEQLKQQYNNENASKAEVDLPETRISEEEGKVDSESEVSREPEVEVSVKEVNEEEEEKQEKEEKQEREDKEENEVIPEEEPARQPEAELQEESRKSHEKCIEKKEDNKSHEKCKDKKENDDCPKGTVGEFFKLIAEDFEEMKDACKEIKRCRWYKVPVSNLEDMCNPSNYNKYTIVYYPMVNYYPYIRRHGHYLLGYKYDSKGRMKYLVYGVPGTKSRTDQPYGGKSGFVTWIPLKEGDENEDSFGYWLMFYDFRTSTIVIPVK